MLLLILIAAIALRFLTNHANWALAVGLSVFVIALAHAVAPVDKPLVLLVSITLSPIIFAANYALLSLLGWVKDSFFQPRQPNAEQRTQ